MELSKGRNPLPLIGIEGLTYFYLLYFTLLTVTYFIGINSANANCIATMKNILEKMGAYDNLSPFFHSRVSHPRIRSH